jgi:hypothetical protein
MVRRSFPISFDRRWKERIIALEVRNPREALEISRRPPERINFLLTEVTLPELSGRALVAGRNFTASQMKLAHMTPAVATALF